MTTLSRFLDAAQQRQTVDPPVMSPSKCVFLVPGFHYLTYVNSSMTASKKDYSVIIPYEVWTLCWDLVSRDDLKSLSRVCQLFRQICQPSLFKEFTFPIPRVSNGNNHNFARSNWNQEIIKEKIEAVQGVVSTPLLVESVERVSISTFYLERGLKGHLLPDPVVLFSDAILKNLPHFSKTKILVLDWTVHLSTDFLNKMLVVANQYLHLEELRLLVENIPPRTLGQFSSLKVLALGSPIVRYHYAPPGHDPSSFLIPASIKELHVRSLTTAPRLLMELLKNNRHHNLTSFDLYLDRRFFPHLLQWFPLCPQLKNLVVNVFSETAPLTPLQFELSETSVPNLEKFTGPLELALIIVPNRPIRRLCIVRDPWKTSTDSIILHDMAQLARSTGPIIELAFTLHIGRQATLPIIANLFPTLLFLSIEFCDDGITPDLEPENGIQIKNARLHVEEPENHSAPKESSGYKVLVSSTANFKAGVDVLEFFLFERHLSMTSPSDIFSFLQHLRYFDLTCV